MGNELMLQFVTGGDDLRGGSDNVNLLLLLQSGTPLRFDNVNRGKRWPDRSTQAVSLPLPDTVRLEDIKGVRLETTFGGGLGGDNWNLDHLTVSARIGGEVREFFDQGGAPLFRFTGDRRVREFAFSTAPITPQPAVKTPFNPASDGFRFVNNFKNIVISEFDVTTSGLCGGMSYAALDYFLFHNQIPQQDYMPAEGTPLQSYLYDRQVTSLTGPAAKWAEYNVNPGGARNREFFNWGLQAGSGRLGELIGYIDRGQPVPLGLLTVQEVAPDRNHQVLAIGYELGRYIGDLGEHIEDLSIFICDPNFPYLPNARSGVMVLKPDVAAAMYIEKDDNGADTGKRWRAYFVDTTYTCKQPPAISSEPNELIVEFVTGDDDLRGGNDNVHLSLLLRDQTPLRFDNVNGGKRWLEHSSQTVGLPLPDTVRLDDIEGVRLETTFGGGLGGDNWNMDKLVVKARLVGTVKEVLSKNGRPLFRFTGNARVSEFRRTA
jgi:hypothetical protein